MRPTTDTQREAKRAEMQQQIDAYMKSGGQIYQAAPGESGGRFGYNTDRRLIRVKAEANQ